jgi:hypothetical protein
MFHPPPKRAVTEREAKAAADLLSVSLEGLTPEIVRSAFRKRAVAAHPDTLRSGDTNAGRDVIETAAETIQLAQEARDVLLHWIESLSDSDDTSCPVCRGRGWIRGRLGATPCTRC